MPDNRCSLIWTVKTGDETAINDLDDTAFLARLQTEFGYRLGQFTQVGKKRPLSTQTHANRPADSKPYRLCR